VNQELRLRNEYLAAENRILRAKLPPRLRLSNPERVTLAEIGRRLGRRVLAEVTCEAKPDKILAWYRKLVAQKFDGSKTVSGPPSDFFRGGRLGRAVGEGELRLGL
jgi:putative transposase